MDLITDTRPFLPGTASLIESLDRRVILILRDGKHLVGTIRSFDQYSNMVLEDSFERVIVGKKYSDIPLGLYIVRGDNMVLCGEIDEDLEESGDYGMEKVEFGTEECNELRLAKAEADQAAKEKGDEKTLWNFD